VKFFNILVVIYLLFFPTIFFAVSEFYFVRHGQTDFNIKKEKKNWNMFLNDTGRIQIKSLEKTIKKLPIEIIFFSPLKRTKETKDIINQYLNVCEISLPEIKEAQEGLYTKLIQLKDDTITFKKLKKFLKRVSSGITKILDCSKLALVVGHGAVYAAICYTLDIKTDIWRIPNGAVVHFYKKSDGSWNIEMINAGYFNIKKYV
jgi:uncharacterized phosphatase